MVIAIILLSVSTVGLAFWAYLQHEYICFLKDVADSNESIIECQDRVIKAQGELIDLYKQEYKISPAE